MQYPKLLRLDNANKMLLYEILKLSAKNRDLFVKEQKQMLIFVRLHMSKIRHLMKLNGNFTLPNCVRTLSRYNSKHRGKNKL